MPAGSGEDELSAAGAERPLVPWRVVGAGGKQLEAFAEAALILIEVLDASLPNRQRIAARALLLLSREPREALRKRL